MDTEKFDLVWLVYILIFVVGLLTGLVFPESLFFENQSFGKTSGVVTKVIDGDTIVMEGKTVRLLGIDSDEGGYPCYQEAKEKLEKRILGRRVVLERTGENKDKYGRLLRYVFLNDTNVNLWMVRNGFAVARFSKNSKYKEDIIEAEEKARENGLGCKWSGGDWNHDESGKEDSSWNLNPGESIELIDVCDAGNKIGETVILEGKVVDSYKGGKAIFLNFGAPYPNSCFTAVIWPRNWDKFPDNPEKFYLEKMVRIKGEVKEYEGESEIILEDRNQIETRN